MNSETGIRNEYTSRINAALGFIERNFSEEIGLEDIASSANISPFHFHRVFSALIGETPGEYLRRLRIEKAASMLYLHPDYSVTRIALESGFTSSAVFSRAFRQRFQTSAGRYRKSIIGKMASASVAAPVAERCAATEDREQHQLRELRQFPEMRLACVRSMSGYGPQIGKAWKILMAWAGPNGLITPRTRFFGIPLDDPDITPGSRCRYFVAMTIDGPVRPSAHIEFLTEDTGWYAVFPFSGRAENMTSFYKYVYGVWLPASGYQPDNRYALEEYSTKAQQKNETAGNPMVLDFSLLLPVRPL